MAKINPIHMPKLSIRRRTERSTATAAQLRLIPPPPGLPGCHLSAALHPVQPPVATAFTGHHSCDRNQRERPRATLCMTAALHCRPKCCEGWACMCRSGAGCQLDSLEGCRAPMQHRQQA
jgi:hypothetical protein